MHGEEGEKSTYYDRSGLRGQKGQKLFDLPERGFEPQIFSKFPAHDLNFHVK
jgi:hypothetical protein